MYPFRPRVGHGLFLSLVVTHLCRALLQHTVDSHALSLSQVINIQRLYLIFGVVEIVNPSVGHHMLASWREIEFLIFTLSLVQFLRCNVLLLATRHHQDKSSIVSFPSLRQLQLHQGRVVELPMSSNHGKASNSSEASRS